MHYLEVLLIPSPMIDMLWRSYVSAVIHSETGSMLVGKYDCLRRSRVPIPQEIIGGDWL